MAEIKIIIPTEKINGIVEAFADEYNYKEQIEVKGELVDNPQTKSQFAKEQVMNFIKRTYKRNKLKELNDDRISLIEEAEEFTNDFN